MRRFFGLTFTAAGLVVALAPYASAHFKMLEPTGWIEEAANGDPQKLGPCGGTTAAPGTPTNVVNKAMGGSKIHIKLQESVYHPGHYRIALSVNSRAELPPDPEALTRANDKGPWSISAPVQNPVKAPLLADGLWDHTLRTSDPFETDVQLPNISCPKCTLQITQFMAEHGYNKDGGYYYHHCADFQITADPKKPIDKGWPAAK